MLPVIQPNTSADLIETRLGTSDYYVSIPPGFEIKEARGKEGQLGYNIMPRDETIDQYGFIEIKRGSPIMSGFDSLVGSGKAFAKARLLDNDVVWSSYKTETGYYSAYTTEIGDLNARASSKDQKQVESMIAIIATLKHK